MVTIPRHQTVNPRLAVIGGGLCVLVVVAAIVLMPARMLESLVWTSGVAALVPAAQPPLGVTARLVLAIVAGSLSGAVGWSVLYLLIGPGGFLVGSTRPARAGDAPPAVRRADAHPDAPPRRPICAAELGEPMMDAPPAEQSLPVNLEQPLAAFDPAAIPAAPREPVRPVAPLPRVVPDAPIDTFDPPPNLSADPLRMEHLPQRPFAPLTALRHEPLGEPQHEPPSEPLHEPLGALLNALLSEPLNPAPGAVRRTPVNAAAEAPFNPSAEPAQPPSIDALLRRLEDGARARAAAR